MNGLKMKAFDDISLHVHRQMQITTWADILRKKKKNEK